MRSIRRYWTWERWACLALIAWSVMTASALGLIVWRGILNTRAERRFEELVAGDTTASITAIRFRQPGGTDLVFDDPELMRYLSDALRSSRADCRGNFVGEASFCIEGGESRAEVCASKLEPWLLSVRYGRLDDCPSFALVHLPQTAPPAFRAFWAHLVSPD